MHARSGFSLFELLVTLSLLAILVSSAVPYLRNSIHSSRMSVEVNALIRAVHIARSEAVKRNGEAVLCPSVDGASCASGTDAWNSGWLVFANTDRDSPPEIDPDEDTLVFHNVSPQIKVDANRLMFAFHNYARRSTNGTLIFCPTEPGPEPRAVVISYTGRPRTAHQRSDGKPYLCRH